MAKKATKKKATRKKVVKKVVAKVMKPTFVFVGNGLDDPTECGFYGYSFTLNGPGVEVDDPRVLVKLRGNSHFKEM